MSMLSTVHESSSVNRGEMEDEDVISVSDIRVSRHIVDNRPDCMSFKPQAHVDYRH